MPWSTHNLGELTSSQIDMWQRLHSQESALGSPFTTYEFCRAVNKVRGDVFVSILENRGKIQAFFPFERSSRFLTGIAHKPGGHLSDCFEIVGGARYPLGEKDVLRAAGLSVFSFDHLPLLENGLPIWRGIVAYGLRVDVPNFGEYVARLRKSNKKFVQEVERHSNQLVQQYGTMDFQWQTSRPDFELKRLIDGKRRQYENTGCRDALKPVWARQVLSELLGAEDKNCEAILSTLYCGDTWIASNLALRSGDLLHIWFPLFNRQLRRFGPGHVLFFKLFESAASQGVRIIDFGGGAAPYKRKYAGYEYPLFKGSLRRINMLSLAHQAARSLSWRVRPFLSK